MLNSEKTMEKIVALCKGRGYVYAGSEIYGGLANTWDYGPLGVEFKNNVKKAWWKKFIQDTNLYVAFHLVFAPAVYNNIIAALVSKVFYKLISSVACLTFLTVHKRIGERAHMA